MAIKIPFVADVSDFLRGTKSVGDSLEDVADALDDVSTAGGEVDAKVGADLDAIADSADETADRLSRSFREAFDTLEREGRTTTRKAAHDVEDFRRDGTSATADFRDEAKQNLAESVSSFQGDAESAVDAVQSTFGGLATAFGGVGLAAVTAVGLGIGAIRGMFAEAEEKAEAYRAKVEALFAELTENDRTISAEFKAQGIQDIIGDSEKLKEIFGEEDAAKVNSNLRKIGLSPGEVSRIFSGLVGGTEDVAAGLETVNEAQEIWHATLLDPSASAAQQRAARENLTNLAQIETSLRRSGDAARDAETQANLYGTALGKLPAEKTTKVTVSDGGTAKLTQQEIDNIRSSGVPVPVHPDMSDFDSSLRRHLNGKVYYATVYARPGQNAET